MNDTVSATPKKMSVKTIAVIGVLTAVTCILAPLSIPIGDVPISLTNLVIYFGLYILGTRRETVSYIGIFIRFNALAASCAASCAMMRITMAATEPPITFLVLIFLFSSLCSAFSARSCKPHRGLRSNKKRLILPAKYHHISKRYNSIQEFHS